MTVKSIACKPLEMTLVPRPRKKSPETPSDAMILAAVALAMPMGPRMLLQRSM